MANRSCLYACNEIPSRDGAVKVPFIGVSEFKWDVPVTFKLLLVGNPRPCPSSIWKVDEDIAIVADLEPGIAALKRFLEKIDSAKSRDMVQEALDYLEKIRGSARYFVLEAGEIFEMTDTDMGGQVRKLIADIEAFEDSSDYKAAVRLSRKGPPLWMKLLSNLLDLKHLSDPHYRLHKLGLGYWGEVLYFDPNESDEDEPEAPEPLAKEDIPPAVTEFMATFKAAYDGEDRETIEGMVYSEGLPDEARASTMKWELHENGLGLCRIRRYDVFPSQEWEHERMTCAVEPEWRVEYKSATSRSSSVRSMYLATVDGAVRVVCRMREGR